MLRRLASLVGAALLISFGVIAVIGRLGRDWEARVAVRGHSMAPNLLDGDWLLVNPDAYARRAPRQGELVVARDPRVGGGRVLVKRVAAADGGSGTLTLAGDHPAHSENGSAMGNVPAASILGRPWFRYWPLERLGPIS